MLGCISLISCSSGFRITAELSNITSALYLYSTTGPAEVTRTTGTSPSSGRYMPFKRTMRKYLSGLFFIFISCSVGGDKSTSKDSLDEPSDEQEMDYRKEYVLTYSQPINFDTSFNDDRGAHYINFRHYCTMDSALSIPARYNFDTRSNFLTHNFKSELTVLSNKDTIFKKEITKWVFYKFLDSALRSYATLLYPNISVKKDHIEIRYSISIPATDVGISTSIRFDKKGDFTIHKNGM